MPQRIARRFACLPARQSAGAPRIDELIEGEDGGRGQSHARRSAGRPYSASSITIDVAGLNLFTFALHFVARPFGKIQQQLIVRVQVYAIEQIMMTAVWLDSFDFEFLGF
jgi:hypothetical protein